MFLSYIGTIEVSTEEEARQRAEVLAAKITVLGPDLYMLNKLLTTFVSRSEFNLDHSSCSIGTQRGGTIELLAFACP